MYRFKSDNRGASDLISYIFIFSIIITLVTLSFAVVQPQIEERAAAETEFGIDRVLSIFHQNYQSVVNDNAQSRSTEVNLRDSQLRSGDQSLIAVISESTVWETGSSTIIYDSPTATHHYEFLALIKENENGKQILEQEDIGVYNENTGTLLLQFTGSSHEGDNVSGGVRQITVENLETKTNSEDLNSERVTIELESDHLLLWESYFEQQDYISSCTNDGAVLSCETVILEEIIIQQRNVQTQFS